ncbi:MAG: hypothetical protein LUE86_02070 [Clostridiales bacterium]|nr:hypothetical protein [Clostridiales bacterium]
MTEVSMMNDKPLKKQQRNNQVSLQQKEIELKRKSEQFYNDYDEFMDHKLGGKVAKQIYTIYENIYMQCIKNQINLCNRFRDPFNDGNVITADMLAFDLLQLVDQGFLPDDFRSRYMKITFGWLLSVCDALGISLNKIMTKMSSKEKREIIYEFVTRQAVTWEICEDTEGKGEISIEFEEDSVSYEIVYNQENRSVELSAGVYVIYWYGKSKSWRPHYKLPDMTLYSEREGFLKKLFLNELYSERLNQETLFKNHGYIQDVLIKPNDKLFRFLSPYTRCVSESGKHSFADVIGVVNILSFKEHKTVVENFNGFYCSECFKYFIPEEEYKRLKKTGIICCKILVSSQSEHEDNPFSGFSTESVLHQYGYNVNALNNLSRENRRDILAFILENNILSRGEIVGHIELLVNLARNRMNMANAISKWESDIAYINSYERTDQFVVDCDAIKVPAREKDNVGQPH